MRQRNGMRHDAMSVLYTRSLIRYTLLRPWIRETAIVALMLVLLPAAFGVDLGPKGHLVPGPIALAFLVGLVGVWVYVNRAAFAIWARVADSETAAPYDEPRDG